MDLQDAYIRVVQAVRSSVVQIQTDSGRGSGVAFDSTGDVVTNNHVVAGATMIQVTTAEGKTQTASLVGAFPVGDLAVIRVAGPLQPAVFADSSTLEVGMISTGDIIIDLSTMRVSTTSELTTLLADLKPGDEVSIRLVTPAGAQRTVTVTLAEIPSG